MTSFWKIISQSHNFIHTTLYAVGALRLATLPIFARLPPASTLRAVASLTNYAIRLSKAMTLIFSATYERDIFPFIFGFHVIVMTVCDGIRVHTMRAIALQSGTKLEMALAILQSTILLANMLLFSYQELYSIKKRLRDEENADTCIVDEQGGGATSTLFFDWLYSPLAFGKENSISAVHFQSTQMHPRAVYQTQDAVKNTRLDMVLQYFYAMALKILTAGSILLQPLLVNLVVKFLEGSKYITKGFGLFLRFFFE